MINTITFFADILNIGATLDVTDPVLGFSLYQQKDESAKKKILIEDYDFFKRYLMAPAMNALLKEDPEQDLKLIWKNAVDVKFIADEANIAEMQELFNSIEYYYSKHFSRKLPHLRLKK